MASRLSYLLWSTMPDEALLAAAEAGELDAPARGVLEHARRMIEDPQFEAVLLHFFDEWLRFEELDGLSKDAEAYPDFYEGLGDLFREEDPGLCPRRDAERGR